MELGVERLAPRLDPGDAVALQHRLQLALGGLHAGHDVAHRRIERAAIGRKGRERTAEIVGDRQHVLGETLDAELLRALGLLLAAAANVLALGDGAQIAVVQLGLLGLELGNQLPQLGYRGRPVLRSRLGTLDRHLSPGIAPGWIAGHISNP